MEKPKVLVVDDELSVRESIRMILKERAVAVLTGSAENALEHLAKDRFDVVLLDILMPGMDGLEALERIKAMAPNTQVIMVTATKTVKTAVTAMKLGACDYVTKPFDVDEMQLTIDRAAQTAALMQEVESLRDEIGRRYSFDNIIGRSQRMQAVLKTVSMVAPLKTTVLITGESGTGKEVIAKAIHFNSPRANKPLVTINCAAIPDNLLESELFGHERGAFTDAYTKKLGQFEHANRGTIFLDEVGEMNPATQAKILRVLEEGAFIRVGGAHPITVDVRVIAATNRDLDVAIRDGRFRSDLYYRLNVVSIHLPPVRERRDDLPALIKHFLALKAKETGLPAKTFTNDALDLLMQYAWPGNVRELENVIERAMVLSHETTMAPEDLPQYITTSSNGKAHPAQRSVLRGEIHLAEAVDEFEEELIRAALVQAEYNQTRAAEILGTTRRILKYKMDKLGITVEEKAAS